MRVKFRKQVSDKERKLCGCTVASARIGQCRLIAEYCRLRLSVISIIENVSLSHNIQHRKFSPTAVFFCVGL